MANNNNMIRMSGMNSGLDTESIINALTANSKLKITKQNRQLLKYKATQEAYQDIISKLQSLKSKYFDLANPKTNLSGTSMWSQYATKTTVNGVEQAIAGFTATTSVDSVAGNYDISVKTTAKQATMKGANLSSAAKFDFSEFTEGETYGITLSVGGESKNITFTAGATAEDTISALNSQLREIYGDSNESQNDPTKNGLVYVDANGQFVSREGKGIALSGAGQMAANTALDLSNLASGNNSIAVQVGDEVVNISFQTLGNDYFTPEKDENGNDLPLSEEKQALYDQVKADYIESKKYEAFENWKATATDEDKELIFQDAFNKAEEKQAEKYFNKFGTTKEGKALWAATYEKFKAEAVASPDPAYNERYAEYLANIDDPSKAATRAEWEAAEKQTEMGEEAANLLGSGPVDSDNEYYNAFKAYYYDHDISDTLDDATKAKRDEALANYVDVEYQKYVDGLGDGETAQSKDDWTADQIAADGEFAANYHAIEDKYNKYTGYQLDETSWRTLSYNEYEAYKSANEDAMKQIETDNATVADQTIIDHYNKSSLNNSIGAAETKSGVKLAIELTDDMKSATITATREVTTDNGDGTTTTTTENVDFSVSASKNSVSDLGVAQATTSISQISNSTKLSELNLAADAEGNYNFTINGISFSFSEDTTVKDMMRKVNASEAGVKMTYSSLENSFTLTSNNYGVDAEINIDSDAQGFLAGIGLNAANFEQGTNLEVEINGKLLESGGNSVTVDGTTFSFAGVAEGTNFTVGIEKDYSAITDTIKSFVEEYNKLIEEVYELLDQKPDKDYYFLADADKEDLDLSDKQEEKWEEKAKLGILYHDSTVTTAMTKLRTALMGTTVAADGKTISLSSIGIKTATDYKEHGKLILDEDTLTSSIATYGEDIMRLFSDKEDGIMTAFADALEYSVGTTGDKGTLINKAGAKTGTSATDNFIYNQMKRITSRIKTLESRYENEQNRLWKKYSAMEKMLGTINSQSASLSSYFGGGTM
ncbi:MAG: flagellar filament capping protein FliD [Bacteroides sp.]|nr:flagellar filament capping protein FliD [Eubacterium sp.]MCM1418544.1 flagellar filament capping protein FliD [Roseburia sp.]MCM1462574.1 flagellar filament capping protein FliD [Bacteroides sp.]